MSAARIPVWGRFTTNTVMTAALLALMAVALIGSRPWRTNDPEWFHASALLGALLLGGLLITLT